ncbi:hypothetical protein KEJ37_00335 [Candidatus Bathyarchaeota archaeon]|nr:hypothetical protein [Candidatus Bathyarchaeota archaeon]
MEIPIQRLLDVLTRVDELLVLLLRVEEQQLKLLQAISEKIGAPAAPAVPHEKIEELVREFRIPEVVVRQIIERVAPPPATVGLTAESVNELARKLAERLPQLPNRAGKIEFDTSITVWKSMREAKKLKPAVALGFWVEEVGGGFEYTIAKGEILSDAKRAEVGDRWDIEFDDIQIRGLGAEGTARIWYWWRE